MNSKALYMVLVLMAGAALVASGCTARTVDLSEQPAAEDKSDEGTSEAEDESAPAEQEAVASATPDRAERVTQTLPPGLEKVEVTPLEPMTGEVPVEILEAILADLVERTGTKSEDIVVVRAETAVWNDGTLGCPKPGEVYIQVLIDGY